MVDKSSIIKSNSNTDENQTFPLALECVNCGVQSRSEELSVQMEFLEMHEKVCPKRFHCDRCEERFQTII